MSGSGVESSTDNSLCTCSQVKQLVGGNISKVLSRSTLFTCIGEEEHLFAAAGDEASNSVWQFFPRIFHFSEIACLLPGFLSDLLHLLKRHNHPKFFVVMHQFRRV